MKTKNEYPFFPELTKEAENEAQELINKFKKKLSEAANEVLSELYCEIAFYIGSDSWTNFRKQIVDGFRNYNNRKIQAEYDFKKIRQEILKEYREDIIPDLNQDMLEEIENLKSTIEGLQELRNHNR